MSSVVEQLVGLRRERGFSQADVAERLGTSQPVISRLEAGGRDPRLSTLERYARVVGADLEVQTAGTRGLAADLADSIRERLDRSEPATKTFREAIQFIDDARAMPVEDLRDAVDQEPLSTGDRRWDAVVAAVVDWVCSAQHVTTPRWTSAARWRVPAPGWVVSPHERLHAVIRAETPPEFARHGVYVDQASLMSV